MLGVLILAGWLTHTIALRYFLSETQERGQATLRLAVASISSALERHERLPQLMANSQQVVEVLRNPDVAETRTALSEELEEINDTLGATDIYVLDNAGLTLSASNHRQPATFVGRNYSYRPYFIDAMKDGTGNYYALGSASGKRGYYFSSRVEADGQHLGVVTVKVAVDQIERSWQGNEHLVLVAGTDDVVFMSSEKRFLYRSLGSLDAGKLETLRASRQYGNTPITELGINREGAFASHSIVSGNALGDDSYLMVSQRMSRQGWKVYVMANTNSASWQALVASLIVILLFMLAMAAAALVMVRRHQLAERLRLQQLARDELEQRVDERTADLNAANTKLRREVRERRATEKKLTQTQEDLVQAGKLAALGQMSAALSHEYNQPLAALKTYAENAVTFLDRSNNDQARGNLENILKLSDRMGSISKRLRNFARKPDDKLKPVPVKLAVEEVLELLGARIKQSGIEIINELPSEDIHVLGGTVRLQQVLVNILSNAIDASEAVSGGAYARVWIAAQANEKTVTILIRDSGAGIDKAIAARIFDPFFSTKGPGKGLGLGLSISYNIVRDFGGRLSVANVRNGGAEFSVLLKRAKPEMREAAE